MQKPEYFLPTNHPYGEHPTYTGPGCATCGKPKEVHTTIAPPPNVAQK